jgi:hypothetical protein
MLTRAITDDNHNTTSYIIPDYTGVPKKEDESITPLFIGGF